MRGKPNINLPLSGAVTQFWKTWASAVTAIGSQFGLVNIVVGKSGDPEVEEAVLTDVASYGRQLGRVEDVLEVLLRRLPPDSVSAEEEKRAIRDFRSMLNEIAAVRERGARRPALRPMT